MNNRIYLSGRISGDPDYKVKFKVASSELVNARRNCRTDRSCSGCVFYDRSYVLTCRISDIFPSQIEVVNPTYWGLETKPYWIALLVCLWRMRKCDYVYMLRDWKQSRGATIEYRWATFLKKKIIYQQ